MVYRKSVFINAMHKNVIIGAALFWGITQPKSVIPNRRYEATRSPIFYGQNSNNLSIELCDELFDSAARCSSPAYFWVPTQRVVVICYRRLGRTCVGKELPLYGA